MSRACHLYGLSRQAVYQRLGRHRQREIALAPVKALVLSYRRQMPRLGTRKLYHLIKPQLTQLGIKLGRDGLFDYLRTQRLLVRPTKHYTKTTNSKHWLKKHPNLLAEQRIDRPEQVLVSDITYVNTHEGVHYLSLVTDAFSRKIMGYNLSRDLKATHAVKALKQALSSRQGQHPLIHHSDRGVQYCSAQYQAVLKANQVSPSMTDGYDCYQNALAERVNGILKQEFLLVRCKTFQQLDRLIRESIDIYNRCRPHWSLGLKTPESVHKKTGYQKQPALI